MQIHAVLLSGMTFLMFTIELLMQILYLPLEELSHLIEAVQKKLPVRYQKCLLKLY